jgi:uncharacterized FlaG/YvyC family protein
LTALSLCDDMPLRNANQRKGDKMASEGTSQVQIHIPEQLISDTIRAEIVRQIPNKEAFAASVIKAALTEKAKDGYGYSNDRGPTIFQKAISDMINAEAKAVFGEWLEQNRTAIREALVKEMTRTQAARVKAIAEKIASGMAQWNVGVNFSLSEE